MSDEQHKQMRARRWRLALGDEDKSGMSASDLALNGMLNQLYGGAERGADLSSSAPKVSRWLGDVRERFPSSVVQIMQKDAFERLNLSSMLTQPEMLDAVEPDIHMVANLISLGKLIPEESKDSARRLVQQLVDELMEKVKAQTEQAITGSLNRAMRTQRPRANDIDWLRTIKANLKNYQPDYQSVVVEKLVGFGRRKPVNLKHIMLCVDQSGSMATSVIYASIFAAVMASMPALNTQLVLFDTAVVDLTEKLADPVDVLFGTQLGGGTDINKAVTYCQQHITKPQDTIMVLITDLYEGGDAKQLVERVKEIKASGVNLITLLSLNDDGAPSYDKDLALTFANLNVPTFACTPDKFSDLMARAIAGEVL